MSIVTPINWPCHAKLLPAVIWFPSEQQPSQEQNEGLSLWPSTSEPWGTSSYLGAKVDRSLTFHHHLECLKGFQFRPHQKALWYFMSCTWRCSRYVDDGTCVCISRILCESLVPKSFLGRTLYPRRVVSWLTWCGWICLPSLQLNLHSLAILRGRKSQCKLNHLHSGYGPFAANLYRYTDRV